MNFNQNHRSGTAYGISAKSLLLASALTLLNACGNDNDFRNPNAGPEAGSGDNTSLSATSDDAAKIFALTIKAFRTIEPSQTKYFNTPDGTSDCMDGGKLTITSSEDTATHMSTAVFDQCLDGNTYINGPFRIESPAPEKTNYAYGQDAGGEALTNEDRGSAQLRSLISGTSFTEEFMRGEQRYAETVINYIGRIENLSKSRVQNFALSSFRISAKVVDAPVFDATFTGNYSFNGDCIKEIGTISTPTALEISDDSNFTGGQLAISTSKGNATLTFKDDMSVDISASDGTKTYTADEIAKICGF